MTSSRRVFRRPQASNATYADASDSTQCRPDYSIRLEAGASVHWLHFDAKYRLNLAARLKQLEADDVEDIEDELTGSLR